MLLTLLPLILSAISSVVSDILCMAAYVLFSDSFCLGLEQFLSIQYYTPFPIYKSLNPFLQHLPTYIPTLPRLRNFGSSTRIRGGEEGFSVREISETGM